MTLPLTIETWDLRAAERLMCVGALQATSNNILEAARLLGITRHSLKRRIIKHKITDNEVHSAERT